MCGELCPIKLNKSSVTFDVSFFCVCVSKFCCVTMWNVGHGSETFLLFPPPPQKKRVIGGIITCCLAATGEFAALFGTGLINKGHDE